MVGGGCAGLALAVALSDTAAAVAVVEARTGERDERTWCYWDTGDALLPEAASHSWDRWEIRTSSGRTVAEDAAHPYRMVRAHDYRAAARARLGHRPSARLIEGVRVAGPRLQDSSTDEGDERIFDARGRAAHGPAPAGRVLLHQRFVGRWVRASRPVFDTSAVTLMDFPDEQTRSGVRFFYVLPIAPDLALVECTVFSVAEHSTEPFGQHIADYVRRRWDLEAHEWKVEGREAGTIAMTDARPSASGSIGIPFGLSAGIARPSTGYAYTRIQRAARRAAAADGAPAAFRDGVVTRVLDAVFLRFLRDQPHRAPEVFLRMFTRLPGPLTIRFLTERATLIDIARLILALPKGPFLRAAAATALERIGVIGR